MHDPSPNQEDTPPCSTSRSGRSFPSCPRRLRGPPARALEVPYDDVGRGIRSPLPGRWGRTGFAVWAPGVDRRGPGPPAGPGRPPTPALGDRRGDGQGRERGSTSPRWLRNRPRGVADRPGCDAGASRAAREILATMGYLRGGLGSRRGRCWASCSEPLPWRVRGRPPSGSHFQAPPMHFSLPFGSTSATNSAASPRTRSPPSRRGRWPRRPSGRSTGHGSNPGSQSR